MGGFNLGMQDELKPQNSLTSTTNLPSAGVSNSVPGRPAVGGFHALSPRPIEGWSETPPESPSGGAADGSGTAPAASGPGPSVSEAMAMANGNPYGGSLGPGVNAANTISTILGLTGVPNPLSGPLAPLSMASMAAQGSQLGATDPVTGMPIATLGMPTFLGGNGIIGASPAVTAAYSPNGTLVQTPLGMTPTFAPDPSTSMATSPFADYTGTVGKSFGGSLGTNNSTDENGMAVGAGTGNAMPGSTNFGARPDPDSNTTQVPDAPPPDANLAEGNTGPPGNIGDPTGDAAAAAAAAAGATAAGVAGDAAGAAASGGTAGGGGDAAMRKGGRVGRPDPRMLAAKLRSGARVDQGSHKAGQDDVPVRLSRGEVVENLPAAKAHAKTLEKWNEDGRQKMDHRGPGGMGVGYKAGGKIADEDARDVHGRPDHRARGGQGGFGVRAAR